MDKKILIGSMLVLTLLLLMPSIPAIQQKSIEEGIKQDIQEKLEKFNFEDIKEMKELKWIRHPILYILYLLQFYFRMWRLDNLELIWDVMGFDDKYLLIRKIMLFSTTIAIVLFWFSISEKLGWNWNLPPIYSNGTKLS